MKKIVLFVILLLAFSILMPAVFAYSDKEQRKTVLDIFKLKCKANDNALNELRKYFNEKDDKIRKLAIDAFAYICSKRSKKINISTLIDLYKNNKDGRIKDASGMGLVSLKHSGVFIEEFNESKDLNEKIKLALKLIEIRTEEIKPHYSSIYNVLLQALEKYKGKMIILKPLLYMAFYMNYPDAINEFVKTYKSLDDANIRNQLIGIISSEKTIKNKKVDWFLELLLWEIMQDLQDKNKTPDSLKTAYDLIKQSGNENYINLSYNSIKSSRNYEKHKSYFMKDNPESIKLDEIKKIDYANEKRIKEFINEMERINVFIDKNKASEEFIKELEDLCLNVYQHKFHGKAELIDLGMIKILIKLGNEKVLDCIIKEIKNGSDQEKIIGYRQLDFALRSLADKEINNKKENQIRKIVNIFCDALENKNESIKITAICSLLNSEIKDYFSADIRRKIFNIAKCGVPFKTVILYKLLAVYPDDKEIVSFYISLLSDKDVNIRKQSLNQLIRRYAARKSGIKQFADEVFSGIDIKKKQELFYEMMKFPYYLEVNTIFDPDFEKSLYSSSNDEIVAALLSGLAYIFTSTSQNVEVYESSCDKPYEIAGQLWGRIFEIIENSNYDFLVKETAICCMAWLSGRTIEQDYNDDLCILMAENYKDLRIVSAKITVLNKLKTVVSLKNKDAIKAVWENASNDRNIEVKKIADHYLKGGI